MSNAHVEVTKIKHVTIAEEVLKQILQLIERGEYQQGDMLPTEREFSELFGVGRSSVREALRVLQSMGVVEKKIGSGTYLAGLPKTSSQIFNTGYLLDTFEIHDLNEARELLEEQIVRMAARRADPGNIEAMRRANGQLKALIGSGDNLEIVKCDFNVHRMIAEGTQNQFLTNMLEALTDVLMKYNVAVFTQDKAKDAVVFHEKIIHAIESGEEELAKAALAEHLKDVHRRITDEYQVASVLAEK